MTKLIKTAGYEGNDRRMNGASKLVWTLMLSACGVVFLGFFTWMSTMQQGLAMANTITLAYGQRLAIVETNATAVNMRLGRIENKLDNIMERINGKP